MSEQPENIKKIEITFKDNYSYDYCVKASRFINTNPDYIKIFQDYFSHIPFLFTHYVKPEKHNLLMLFFMIENKINKLPIELWELISDFAMYGKEYSIDTFPQFSLYVYFGAWLNNACWKIVAFAVTKTSTPLLVSHLVNKTWN